MTKKFQVVGIGNAMVDVLAQTSDAFLADNGVEKGIMQLIDMARGVELYGKVGPATEMSGGSAANEPSTRRASRANETTADTEHSINTIVAQRPSRLPLVFIISLPCLGPIYSAPVLSNPGLPPSG